MEEKLKEKTEASIKKILDEGLTTTNLDSLYKLAKINHMVKEEEKMNYGEYGNYRGRGNYGESYGEYNEGSYGEYGARRGRRRRYRGDDSMDRISEEYGRYQESRQRYGASEETDKSFHYMVKALEDFIKVLQEEADTQQQKMELKQVLQNSVR